MGDRSGSDDSHSAPELERLKEKRGMEENDNETG